MNLTQVKPSVSRLSTLKQLVSLLESHPSIGSRRKLAKRSSVSRGVLDAIHRGQTSDPTPETLQRLYATVKGLEQEGRPLELGGCPLSLESWEALAELPVTQPVLKGATSLPLNPQVDVGIRGAGEQNFCVIAVAVVPLGAADQANSDKIQSCLQQAILQCIKSSLNPTPEMTDKKTDFTGFDQSAKACNDNAADHDCCDHGLDDSKPSNLSNTSPDYPRTIDLAALEQTFTSNSALLLATLIDAEASRRNLDLEGFARALARSVNPEPSAQLTQRFKAQLEDVNQRRTLPEDAAQRLTLLALLANNLKDFEGKPFEGDVDKMLTYLGVE